MVQSLKATLCKLESWWDTACAICLTLRTLIYAFVKMVYLFGLLAGLFVIGEWSLDNAPPYRLHSIRLESVIVPPGGHVRLHMDLEKLRLCPGTVKRSLGGACGNVDVVKKPTTLPVGRTRDFEADLPVPEDVQDGAICIARISVEYECNPWDHFFPEEYFFPEMPFTVRKHAPNIERSSGATPEGAPP